MLLCVSCLKFTSLSTVTLRLSCLISLGTSIHSALVGGRGVPILTGAS